MPKRILIVDDDVEALRLVGLVLERKGYEIQAAATGGQALEKATQEPPDLVILDVMMPDMDGYKIAQRLRDNPETSNAPILFFTAKGSITDKIAGFQAGGDDYLTKPIHPAELVSRVEVLLQRSRYPGDKPQRGKIVAFLPVKGGVGNSMLALNAALELSKQEQDKKTVLIEFANGGGTVALQMGNSSAQGIQRLIRNRTLNTNLLDGQMLGHPTGLRILPASKEPSGSAPLLTEGFAQSLLGLLMADYDYVLFDLQPTLEKPSKMVLRRAQHVILSIEPTSIGLTLAKEMLTGLETLNIGKYKVSPLIIYRAPAATALNRQQVNEALHQEMIASLPPIPDLAHESWASGRPVVTSHTTNIYAQQIRMVVENIQEYI